MRTFFALLLFFVYSAPACLQAQDTDRPWIYKELSNDIRLKNTTSPIRTGDLKLLSKISALSTTQDSYDVYAPFDGRIEEIHVELFDTVDPDTIIATEFTTELAALVDGSPEVSKKQTRRRWQDIFKPFYVKPEEKGIVTRIHVTPKTQVYAGDRLFTVSRKVLMIGKNTEPIYNPLLLGMTAEVEHFRSGDNYSAKLTRFIPIKDKPYFYRLWLEVLDIKRGMAIGEQFNGDLTIAKSLGTRIVDRVNVLRHGGKKYVIMEVETGLETSEEIELIRPITRVLNWEYLFDGEPAADNIRKPEKVLPYMVDNWTVKTTDLNNLKTPKESDRQIGTPTVVMDSGTNKAKPQIIKKKTVKKKNVKKAKTAAKQKPTTKPNTVKAPTLTPKKETAPTSFIGVDGSNADKAVQEKSAPERTPEAQAAIQAGAAQEEPIVETKQSTDTSKSSEEVKPTEIKVDGDTIQTPNNDAATSEFLESEE